MRIAATQTVSRASPDNGRNFKVGQMFLQQMWRLLNSLDNPPIKQHVIFQNKETLRIAAMSACFVFICDLLAPPIKTCQLSGPTAQISTKIRTLFKDQVIGLDFDKRK